MSLREDLYWNTFLPAFFARVSDIIRNRITEELAPYGLTYAHGIYLMALILRDGQSMTELSRFLDMDHSNTNHVIKVLKEKDLVYDDRKSPSSKKFRILLTDEGKELGHHLMDFQIDCMNKYFSEISDDELLSLRNILIKLMKSMDPEIDDYIECKYRDPFYTYLHVDMGDDAKYHAMKRDRDSP